MRTVEDEDQLLAGTGAWPAVAVAAGGLYPVSWVRIGDDGEESVAQGLVWDVAPPWAGQRAWWVRTRREDAAGEVWGGLVLVVRSRRRQDARRGPAGRGVGSRAARVIWAGEAWNDWAMRDWQRREAGRPARSIITGYRPGSTDEIIIRQWYEKTLALVRA